MISNHVMYSTRKFNSRVNGLVINSRNFPVLNKATIKNNDSNEILSNWNNIAKIAKDLPEVINKENKQQTKPKKMYSLIRYDLEKKKYTDNSDSDNDSHDKQTEQKDRQTEHNKQTKETNETKVKKNKQVDKQTDDYGWNIVTNGIKKDELNVISEENNKKIDKMQKQKKEIDALIKTMY